MGISNPCCGTGVFGGEANILWPGACPGSGCDQGRILLCPLLPARAIPGAGQIFGSSGARACLLVLPSSMLWQLCEPEKACRILSSSWPHRENAFQAGKEILLSSQESREWLMAKLMGLKRNLGLDYEAQLRENVQEGGRRDFSPSPSLKSLLLSLTGDKAGREFPFFQARTLLQALTGLQLLHVYAPSEKGASLHLLGWLSLPERVAPFYLSFGESGDQEEKAGRIIQRQVYIHTVTPKLGRILTELRLVESYLSCMVTVEKRRRGIYR